MDKEKTRKILLIFAVAYWGLVVLIYAIASPQFHYSAATSNTLSPVSVVDEIVDGDVVRQRIVLPADNVDAIELMSVTYGRENHGTMNIRVLNADSEALGQCAVDISQLTAGAYTRFSLDAPIQGYRDEIVTLEITTQGCDYGNAVGLYKGNTVTTGRFDMVKNVEEQDRFTINGTVGDGMLCIKLNGINRLNFYRQYWFITGGIFVACAAVCVYWWHKALRGYNNPLVMVSTLFIRYGFLMRQLVARDFKTKYKRSMLGMAWSFLNPLLTMSVQYVVFSTLFKSNVENYRIYLLSGIVFFNFFNEAVSMCMTSITGNASLIKKVYMPKYIYPLSRIISSLINFGLALIPLILVMIFTGTPLRPSMLLLIYVILCQLGFVTGMGLLLTTSMTFFQDTQFLWGVVSMMWMYLTPVFYPESIIPQNMLTVYHMNPLYQYLTFARVCIIDGVSPAPTAYLWCIVSSIVVLLIGILVFKKQQDKFVLNI